MSHLEYRLITHAKKVCSLYKRACRNAEGLADDDIEVRYEVAKIRARFEENKDIKDMRIAKKLLIEGEQELFHKADWQPLKFPSSPGGVAYDRYPPLPDYILDLWHPLERAQYPKYFALREKRKKEYVAMWERRWGKRDLTTSDHH